MCGISGIFSTYIDDNKISLLSKINNCLSHRGPDNSCVVSDRNIVFGHKRLSILDLSENGHQPMDSRSKRYIITFNGEIYNHLQIRKKYFSNYLWKSNSDTETLIELIDKFGLEKSLKIIEGMFAFGIWDKKEKKLVIARDKFGEKPIYFGLHGDKFIFASELKGFEFFKEDLKINFESVKNYLNFSYISSPNSIYQNIYKLNPASFLSIDLKFMSQLRSNNFIDFDASQVCYWSKNNDQKQNRFKSYDDYKLKIKDQLEKSVKEKMISDVPLGIFLSGGIDSSLVASIASKISKKKIDTFTISSDSINFDESERALQISKFLKTNHHTINVSNEDQINLIEDLNNIFDEPFADSSQIPSLILSRYTKKFVKVALTGDGADEIFCGYNRYIYSKKIWKKIKYLPNKIKKIIAYLIYRVPPNQWKGFQNFLNKNILKTDLELLDEKMYKLGDALNNSETILDHYKSHLMIWQNNEEIFLKKKKLNISNDLLKEFNISEKNFDKTINLLDIETYLPDDILVKTDRSSMKFGLETRSPYLSSELFNLANDAPQNFNIDEKKGKLVLRDLLKEYLPEIYSTGPKKGFSIPMNDWLNNSLKDWAEDLFNSKVYKENNFLNKALVNKYWKDHKLLRANHHKRIWNILILIDWLNKKKLNF